MHTEPVFFAPNRVWRCYTGGKLLDLFTGKGQGKDDYFPEDWLASVTRAINGEHSQGPDEGLVRTVKADGSAGDFFANVVAGDAEGLLGKPHVAKYGANSALLCKYLDSSVRLPIQCHPDRQIARQMYHSPFGKTESWTILDSRPINGEEPYLLMGFKPGVDRKEFIRSTMEQDIPAMVDMLHKIPAEVGKTYFIPGRMPHAIGTGVFMLEVQEPTDWVIHTERHCAATRLSDESMWGPLTPEQCMDVFDYTGLPVDELLKRIRCVPAVKEKAAGGTVSEVIGSSLTDAFALWRAEIKGTMSVKLPRAFGVVVAASGSGTMKWPGGQRAIKRGDYFFQPAGLTSIEYVAPEGLSLLLCMPPETK